jgi:hypothetical protein
MQKTTSGNLDHPARPLAFEAIPNPDRLAVLQGWWVRGFPSGVSYTYPTLKKIAPASCGWRLGRGINHQ